MSDNSQIEWTDATWNPVTGCTIVSAGCANCYAMSVAGRMEAISIAHEASHGGDPGPMERYRGTTQQTRHGKSVWTGLVKFVPEALEAPLRWKKPRRIFVNSMSDLFHESVPDEWIDRVFAVMALCPQHTFQVLTKRPERMRAYLTQADARGRQRKDAIEIAGMNMVMEGSAAQARAIAWPLPHVWLGTSVEDQAAADRRIPELLATPAAVRFISAEPLLGPINLHEVIPDPIIYNAVYGMERQLDWVIVGGESGAKARPMHPDWARSLRDQCVAAGVAFFFKQWGEWEPRELWSGHQGGGRFERMLAVMPDGTQCPFDVAPQDVGAHRMAWVGKKAAGRLLDGVEHDAMPVRP